MADEGANLHQLRSTLSVIKMQLQIGGYPRELLLRQLEEAIGLLDAAGAEKMGPAEPAQRLGRSASVVVIDDERRLADVLARRLAREGLATRAAYDIRGACAGTDGRRQEVVILDLSVLDGAGAEERAWAAMARPIVITGASRREAERLLGEIEPFALVEKPFSSEELALLVRRRAAEARA